jgi:hypothetical protein
MEGCKRTQTVQQSRRKSEPLRPLAWDFRSRLRIHPASKGREDSGRLNKAEHGRGNREGKTDQANAWDCVENEGWKCLFRSSMELFEPSSLRASGLQAHSRTRGAFSSSGLNAAMRQR